MLHHRIVLLEIGGYGAIAARSSAPASSETGVDLWGFLGIRANFQHGLLWDYGYGEQRLLG